MPEFCRISDYRVIAEIVSRRRQTPGDCLGEFQAGPCPSQRSSDEPPLFVGVASAISVSADNASSNAQIITIVCVLPVPGAPEIRQRFDVAATMASQFCNFASCANKFSSCWFKEVLRRTVLFANESKYLAQHRLHMPVSL